jgi:O-antigen/teichoic acid export membrane protein
MRKLLLTIPFVLTLAGATMLFERPAYAYADPGTGLLAIQAVGSALVATGWYMRRKIYAFLHRDAVSKDQPEDCPAGEQDSGSSLQ